MRKAADHKGCHRISLAFYVFSADLHLFQCSVRIPHFLLPVSPYLELQTNQLREKNINQFFINKNLNQNEKNINQFFINKNL